MKSHIDDLKLDE